MQFTDTALLAIPGHVGEDVDNFIEFTKTPTTASATILASSRDMASSVFQIFVEKVKIGEWNSLPTAYMGLLAVHYVFHLSYPRTYTKTLTFLQKYVAKLNDQTRKPDAVLNFLTKLQ